MSKWKKYLALAPADKLMFLLLVLLLPAINLALWMMGLRRLRSILGKVPPKREYAKSQKDAVEEANRLAKLVSAAARHGFYHATCLRQSLLLWWLLRWRGIESDLRIGIQKRNGQVCAHSWVKINDTIINDVEEIETLFSPFEKLAE